MKRRRARVVRPVRRGNRFSERWPIATMVGADRAVDVRRGGGGSRANVQPPPWPFSERTRPCSRRPAITHAHHHRVGGHRLRKLLGCDRLACFDHVEQAMQDTGQAAIADHVTSYVT